MLRTSGSHFRHNVVAYVALFFALVGVLTVSQPALGSPGPTELVSVTPGGTTGNEDSGYSGTAISEDGRFVAFASIASDLVPGDTNGKFDVFVRDRHTGVTELVSVNRAGQSANEESVNPVISYDGRIVAFYSEASDLIADDRNGDSDVFVRDRLTDQTTRVSVDSAGGEHEGVQFTNRNADSLSADGRFVGFSSTARLVPDDTNNTTDVYVRDRQTGTTTIVSRGIGGIDGNGKSFRAEVSADGRYVAFGSEASNLVAGDTNGRRDVFVRDRSTGATARVSVDSAGVQANDTSFVSSISADGRYVGFASDASNLVPGDSNETQDVFVHDRLTGATTRVNVASDGAQANGYTEGGDLDADGRYVVFESFATNLVSGDTNTFGLDVFRHDRQTGITTVESVDSAGLQRRNFSLLATISPDGNSIVFTLFGESLTDNEDTNNGNRNFSHGNSPFRFDKPGWDVFVHEPSPVRP